MTLGSEIRRLRTDAGLTQAQLADRVGVTQAFLSALENGTKTGMTAEVMFAMSHELGVPPDHWREALREAGPRLVPARHRDFSLPIAGVLACGKPADPGDDPGERLSLAELFGREELVVFQARGSSMVGAHIQDGDWVVVRPRETAENGELVVAEVDGELTLKRWGKRGAEVILYPCNRVMKPIHLKPGSNIRIKGIYQGVIRKAK